VSVGLAEAVHAVEFVLDQVRVADWPSVTAAGDEDNVTVGFGGGGGGGGVLPPPQPLIRARLQRSMLSSADFFIADPKCFRQPRIASNDRASCRQGSLKNPINTCSPGSCAIQLYPATLRQSGVRKPAPSSGKARHGSVSRLTTLLIGNPGPGD